MLEGATLATQTAGNELLFYNQQDHKAWIQAPQEDVVEVKQ